jgi:hypothetical protein
MGLVGGPDKDRPKFTQTASESFESGDPNNQLTSPNAADLLLVPDGAGGLLYAGSSMDYGAGSNSSVMVKRLLNPRESDAGPSFTLPSLEYINQLVVGENDTAYAAGAYEGYYGARIVAFDINGGGKKWDYDPPYGEPYDAWADIVAALPAGGVAASVGYWQEPRIAFTLDASGNRTDAAAPIGDTYVTYSGVGSDTWYSNPCTATTYCYVHGSGGELALANTPTNSSNSSNYSSAIKANVSTFIQTSQTPQKLGNDRRQRMDFPPLPSCVDQGGEYTSCPGPSEAIRDARADLIARLGNQGCSGKANQSVFSKLIDANDKPLDSISFVRYMTEKTPLFYDGTVSTWAYSNVLCGTGWSKFFKVVYNWGCKIAAPGGDIALRGFSWDRDAHGNLVRAGAVAGTPSYPLIIFFDPDQIALRWENSKNEATIFHEALHGITGKEDNELQSIFHITVQKDSSNITDYIFQNVVSQCPAISGK